MTDFEKLGAFYLGKEYNQETDQLSPAPLLYDSKDLTTHAMCVGMTGSGKTGLCIGLLEEAAIDGIPALVIDPKGDLTNLMLTFPELDAKSFQPWVNADEAAKKNLSVEEFAANQAEIWRNGLSEWGQDASRIKRLRDSADFAVYTPGSSAGRQISILNSLAAPAESIRDDLELLTEQVSTTVSSLLSLIDVDADPIRSKEHILLSNILNDCWRNGLNLELSQFIRLIQDPPVDRIGVFELDSFIPERERFDLAMRLNNLLAAPSFQSWLTGDPLEVDDLLYSPTGKPRVSILSISHLNDKERMFFVSLLLTHVVSWMRRQSGTSSLRAIIYMDEIFGFFPPVAVPPSKLPLMTLLKQARAFGLGVVLATQNPVDLDYRGLSNIGTWFLGRLQTERDKLRVLDGLENVRGQSGRNDRKYLSDTLSSLGKRTFLLNNVHDDQPLIFKTRWVLSYLRGPMTRDQIRRLGNVDSPPQKIKPTSSRAVKAAAETPLTSGRSAVTSRTKRSSNRPLLPPGIAERFLSVDPAIGDDIEVHYIPMVHAEAQVYFADARASVASEESVSLLVEGTKTADQLDWKDATPMAVLPEHVDSAPDVEAANYAEIPDELLKSKTMTSLKKSLQDHLYRNRRMTLLLHPDLKEFSRAGESERDFRIRLQHLLREERDGRIETIRRKYSAKIARIEAKLARSQAAVAREQDQARQQKLQTFVSMGSTLLGALLGRKAASHTTVGRASSTIKGAGRILKERKDVERARQNVSLVEQQLEDLQVELQDEIEEIKQRFDSELQQFEEYSIKPKKKDIVVKDVSLLWAPYAVNLRKQLEPVWIEAS